LTSVDETKGYYLYIKPGHPAKTVSVVGTVIETDVNMATMGVGYNMVGMPFPATRLLANTGLVASGFTGGTNVLQSDRVIYYDNVQGTNLTAWYSTSSSSWQSANGLTSFEPGRGYYIYRKSGRTPETFSWTFPFSRFQSWASGVVSQVKGTEPAEVKKPIDHVTQSKVVEE